MSYNDGRSFVLLEYDKNHGTLEYFCKDATCRHDTNACPAGLFVGHLENYYGDIFMFRHNDNEQFNHETHNNCYVSRLVRDRFEMGNDPVGGFVHAGGHLYVYTMDGGFGYFPSSGREFILLQEETYFLPRAEIGEYLYGTEYAVISGDDGSSRRRYTISRIKTGDPNALPEVVVELSSSNIGGRFRSDGEYLFFDDDEYRLIRSDLDGGNIMRMTDIPLLLQSLIYDGEYLYFSWNNPRDMFDLDNGKFHRMKRDGSTPPELLAHFDVALEYIFPAENCDYFFVTLMRTMGWHTINKDGTGLKPIPWE